MDLLPDLAQQRVMDEAADLLASNLPGTTTLALSAWTQRGWFADTNVVDQALRFRMLGRVVVPGPFLATTLAAALAAEYGDDKLGRRIAGGEESVAIGLAGGTNEPLRVFDGANANWVLVMSVERALLMERTPDDEYFERRCIDPSTQLGTIVLRGSPRCEGDGRWWLLGSLLTASMAAGIAEATRDQSADHARTRYQFGRPIGTFQAMKHRCSAMAIRAEAAWCQVAYAAMSLDARALDAPLQVHAAKVVAIGAAIENCADNIQIHGALGCTTEHSAHLYLKRAHVVDRLCSPAGTLRRALLDDNLSKPDDETKGQHDAS